MLVFPLSINWSPHSPTLATGGGGVIPPPPPSPARNTSSQTPTTYGSGTDSSTTSTNVHTLTIQNTYVTPFSNGMSGFDISLTLTYSILKTIGMGTGISTTHLQGYLEGTSTPYNFVPYAGGHIPPPSPSLGGAFQQAYRPNANSIMFSEGIQRPQPYTNRLRSMLFSLFGTFWNNTFSSSAF
jgi:hypothetical protein